MTAPRTRAGDSDRQAVVDRLTTHFTEGRLDPNEYDERVQKAYAAAYLDEFGVLFEDLPEPKEPSFRDASWSGFGQSAVGWPVDGWSRGGPPWKAVGCGGGSRSASWAAGAPPYAGRGRPPAPRPPSIVGLVLMVVGVVFLLTMLTGIVFFGLPLLWIGLVVFFLIRGGARRRRWEAQRRGWDRSGSNRY